MLLTLLTAHIFMCFLKITTIIRLLLPALIKTLLLFTITFSSLNKKVLKAYYIGIASFKKLYNITDPLF